MKVKELIKILKKMPDDFDVVWFDYYFDNTVNIDRVAKDTDEIDEKEKVFLW